MPENESPIRTNATRKKQRLSYDQSFSLNGKVPPQATELEEAVLGALMLDQDALSTAIESLHKELFYKMEHQTIFQAIHKLFEESQPVDILTVTERLRQDGRLEEAGGAYYVSNLTNRVVSAAHIEYHTRILSEKYIQRELIRISTETIRDSYDETTDVVHLLDQTEQRFLEIGEKNFRSDYKAMSDVVGQALTQIEKAQENEGELSGLSTGFIALDRHTAGFQPGTLIILAARPAMGKTAFALSIARNMAMTFRYNVAFFSLEMTAVELVQRLISSESGISGERLKKGEKLSQADKENLLQKAQELSNANIFIDDTPQLTIFELRAKCRRIKQSKGLDMVFIDYLQLMQGNTENNKNGNREQEISYISRQLKALSKELEVPVFALSQLSRSVETRGGSKIPQLSDLRESGAIEQDADIVMFIYRPEYYGITEDDGGSTIGKADIILAKHRSGAVGNIRLRFISKYAKFENDDTPGESIDDGGFSSLMPSSSFDSEGQRTQIFESKMNDDFSNGFNGGFDDPSGGSDFTPF